MLPLGALGSLSEMGNATGSPLACRGITCEESTAYTVFDCCAPHSGFMYVEDGHQRHILLGFGIIGNADLVCKGTVKSRSSLCDPCSMISPSLRIMILHNQSVPRHNENTQDPPYDAQYSNTSHQCTPPKPLFPLLYPKQHPRIPHHNHSNRNSLLLTPLKLTPLFDIVPSGKMLMRSCSWAA